MTEHLNYNDSISTPEVDAVVTWVDGADPEHAASLRLHLGNQKRSLKTIPGGHHHSRFHDNNEIEFCIRGIRTFLPWIRTIHLVTANQRPAFLTDNAMRQLGVNLVSHSDLFRGYEFALPTFNSITIGTMLHRIRGLSPRYIYFNDDVIPIAPSDISDFFRGGGVVLRGTWKRSLGIGPGRTETLAILLRAANLVSSKIRTAHHFAQMKAAAMAGFRSQFFQCTHSPHPVRTHTLQSYFAENEDVLKENIKHKFRHLDQFVSHPLAHHLEAMQRNTIESSGSDSLTIDFTKPDSISTVERLNEAEFEGVKYVCVQALEHANEADRARLLGFLSDRIGRNNPAQVSSSGGEVRSAS